MAAEHVVNAHVYIHALVVGRIAYGWHHEFVNVNHW